MSAIKATKSELANCLGEVLDTLNIHGNSEHREVAIKSYMLLTNNDINSTKLLLRGEEIFTGFEESDFIEDVEVNEEDEQYKLGYSQGSKDEQKRFREEFLRRIDKALFGENKETY